MPESKHGPYFLFKLFCLKNVRHQTAVSSQLTACTTLIYHFDTYDTRFHSLAFPPLLLADCHQALWVGMRSKIQNDGHEDWENAQAMFSPPSLCSVLQCPITSIGQLHVTMTSFYYNYKNPSVCCFLVQFRAIIF